MKHHSDNDQNIKKKYGESRQHFLNFRVVAQGFGQLSDATRKFLFYQLSKIEAMIDQKITQSKLVTFHWRIV